MLCAINFHQDATLCEYTKMKLPFLPFVEPNLCNDYILSDLKYIDRFCINFPCHFVSNQVDSDTDLLDNVILIKVTLQPIKKPRGVDPHKSKLKSKKTISKKKTLLKSKKFMGVSTRLCEGSADPSSDEKNILQQRLTYTNKDLKKYPFINTSASIPIVAWKLTKNCSHIISDLFIPDCLLHSANNQRFKLDAESPSISEKDIESLYYLIGRLLLTSKITISDVQACVTYILTRIELSTNYHNGRHLHIDILFVKRIRMFVLSSIENTCTHFEMLFSKYKNYILNILQQSIQSQRLKNVFTVL